VNFVLDASVTLCWFFLDGKPAERAYALGVLESMKLSATGALVPVTWGLEISNVIGKAENKGLITEAQSEAFLEMPGRIDISADTAAFSRALADAL
jgi:hypothetical protein